MIETEQSILINAAIDSVWGYVNDIEKWSRLMPGCRSCTVLNPDESRWTIKVGVGGLIKTIIVLVRVDQWDAPQRVNFSYRLESDPVTGGGSYVASQIGAHETEITLRVHVEGSGPMAPLWEVMSRPLLPQLAKHFAGQLKSEIEKAAGAPLPASHSTRQ